MTALSLWPCLEMCRVSLCSELRVWDCLVRVCARRGRCRARGRSSVSSRPLCSGSLPEVLCARSSERDTSLIILTGVVACGWGACKIVVYVLSIGNYSLQYVHMLVPNTYSEEGTDPNTL